MSKTVRSCRSTHNELTAYIDLFLRFLYISVGFFEQSAVFVHRRRCDAVLTEDKCAAALCAGPLQVPLRQRQASNSQIIPPWTNFLFDWPVKCAVLLSSYAHDDTTLELNWRDEGITFYETEDQLQYLGFSWSAKHAQLHKVLLVNTLAWPWIYDMKNVYCTAISGLWECELHSAVGHLPVWPTLLCLHRQPHHPLRHPRHRVLDCLLDQPRRHPCQSRCRCLRRTLLHNFQFIKNFVLSQMCYRSSFSGYFWLVHEKCSF